MLWVLLLPLCAFVALLAAGSVRFVGYIVTVLLEDRERGG
jgi:hypothetical protein